MLLVEDQNAPNIDLTSTIHSPGSPRRGIIFHAHSTYRMKWYGEKNMDPLHKAVMKILGVTYVKLLEHIGKVL